MTKSNDDRHPDAEGFQQDLEGLVGYNLKRAYMIVQSDFRIALGVDGLSTRAFSALSIAVQFPNITQSALSRILGIERSGLVAIVDDLEARGLLLRSRIAGDRRAQALVPTVAGKKSYQAALDTAHKHEKSLLSSLTAAEREVLISLLQKIRKNED